jgi:tetratricopeptide (TPR) repeat protein
MPGWRPPGRSRTDQVSDSGKAVFLSYASQDAEAAKRIAEALRAAGVEVWFDQSELRGGDAWDGMIRKRIKECTLFVPVITPNTNARAEGYFRLEWKLAVDRSHLMADDAPFLFPVVIGDVTDAAARVPDKFREVQWTRLRLDETPGELAGRVARLLRDGSLVGGVLHPDSAKRSGYKTPPTFNTARWQWWMIYPILGTLMGLMFAAVPLWKSLQGPARREPPKIEVPVPPAKSATASVRDWPADRELKRATGLLDRNDAIPEDFRLAEEITQRVLDRSPTDAETLTAMARVQSMWLMRGWDRSTARFQKAKATTERALQLAPDEPEAYAALAAYLFMRGNENQRALDLAQRAVDLAPGEPRFYRLRDSCLWVVAANSTDVFTGLEVERTNPALERALASARRTAELFPKDALVRYDLARHYRDLGRWKECEKELDAALALAPVANVIVWKARVRFGLHDDLVGMKALLDQVPARVRGVERTVFGYFLYSAFTGETRDGLDALNGMPETWMIDFDYRGPKALPTAALLELAGKRELARLQYEGAWAELRRSRGDNPADLQTFLVEAWILHGLGRGDEARAALRIYLESVPRPFVLTPISTWWFQPIAACLLMGERATALTLIREAATGYGEGRAAMRSRLALDRRMAPFRDDPEIKALLAEPAERP